MKIVLPTCSSCTLYKDADKIIWGQGEKNSPDLFVIAEAPKALEHYKEQPYISPDGELLKKTLNAIHEQTDLKDFTYYLTYLNMCRPPDDRSASENEINCCFSRLISEIEEYKPKSILCLGGVVSAQLINEKIIAKARGTIHKFRGIPTAVTYAPGFLLAKFKQNYTYFKTFSEDIIRLLEYTKGLQNQWIDLDRWGEYELLQTEDRLLELFNQIRLASVAYADFDCSFDIETFGLDAYEGKILVYGFDFLEQTYIVPVELFEKCAVHFPSTCSFTVHRSFMEYPWMHVHHNIQLTNLDDTLLLYSLLDERTRGVHKDLKTAAHELLGVEEWDAEIKPFIAKMHLAPKERVYKYLACDVQATTGLKKKLMSMLEKEGPAMINCYNTIIRPAIPKVNKWCAHGIRIDLEYLETQDAIFTGYLTGYVNEKGERIEGYEEKIKRIVGEENFNPRSTNEVSYYLYNRKGLPNPNRNSTDEPTVKTLLEHCYDHELLEETEFLETLLDYREIQKLLSTYIRGLHKLCAPDGRIHTELKLDGAATGRMSSVRPNLQNIPIRGKFGNLIRLAFLPDENHLLCEPDYSQLELRVGAHCSNDDKLIEFLNSGGDMHREMAALILGVASTAVSKLERQFGKNVVFGVMYDILAKELVYTFKKDFPFLTLALATKAINLVRGQFPKLYLNALDYKVHVHKYGYVDTMFGRRRRFPLITNDNKKKILGQATNAPIQGGATDICLKAAMKIDELLPDVKIHFLVHDAIPNSIPINKPERADDIKAIMENVDFETRVKFVVDVKVGERWGME